MKKLLFIQCIYGVSKVFGYHATVYYRAYGIYAANGILFNHESPRRGQLLQKIVQALVRIKFKNKSSYSWKFVFGKRLGTADYVKSMWKILQYKTPDDWVIATNKDLTVKQFINKGAKKLK